MSQIDDDMYGWTNGINFKGPLSEKLGAKILTNLLPFTTVNLSQTIINELLLVRVKLPNAEITRRSESCQKGNCHVYDFICDTDTFTTKACGKTFKI